MKKRTLVCFLIFTLCVFYTSIPNIVFGQEEEASLAEQVFEKYGELLQREDIQAVLPQVLEGLKDPAIQPLLNAATIGLVVDNPDLLTNFVPDIDPVFVTLLKEDAELQAMLSDPLVHALLQDSAAIDELAELLAVDTTPPGPVPEPDQGETPEPDQGETPEPDQGETPEPDQGETPEPDQGETPEPDQGETPEPDQGETPEPDQGETPEPLPVVITSAEPFQPIMPTNDYLLGKSRLGGLSANPFFGQRFINEIIATTGLSVEADEFVDLILSAVPPGYLPKKQLRQILMSKRVAVFAEEAEHLDYENFGNAITPNFTDFSYGEQSSKYLTRDSLHLYTRVPAKVDGVMFSLRAHGMEDMMVPAMQVGSDELSDSIAYTFRLEEVLAATNLPAWSSLNTQLFTSVTLRYSGTTPKDEYAAYPMQPTFGENGVVWETQVDISLRGNHYYYFEVTLTEPLVLKTLDREALASADPETITLADILNATREYQIDGWAMPDPRNLQIVDRGIINGLFTPNLWAVVGDIIAKIPAGQPVNNINQILDVVSPQQLNTVRRILLNNANELTTQFEEEFDPMLASVFSIGPANLETDSLWVARISDLEDGNYQLATIVHDAAGNPLDLIQENLTVDTTAPEASVRIAAGANAGGYLNGEGVYVATAASGSGALNIIGAPKYANVGPGEGYLFYQMIGLDENGNPDTNIEPNTWMPLDAKAMIASRIWAAIQRAVAEGRVDVPANSILQAALALPLEELVGLLTPDLVQEQLNPILRGLEPFVGRFQLTESQAEFIAQAVKASVDIVNSLVPVTYEAPHRLSMPIVVPTQGMHINYGIRAMGIDSLFNVGAYAEPTRLRIVAPEYDMASVTSVSIGDRNSDGDADEPYESGTIFANTTDGVMLTITINNRTVHPASFSVEYMDANGDWQPIGEPLELAENENLSTFDVSWDVADFDALVSAGDTVMVRTVATNALQLTNMSDPSSVNLDAGVHPVDLDILALVLDRDSITKINPDSGGPQGTVTINVYTPQRTYPEVASLQLKISDEVVGTTTDAGVLATAEEMETLKQDANFVTDLVQGALDRQGVIYLPAYMKYSVDVDTTAVEDTITVESPAARDVSKDENQHKVTATAITSTADEIHGGDAAVTYLSVDNVDDVPPVGPTNIVNVADVAGDIIANEDGSYTIGGIVDETVPSPIATFTTEPTADPTTYASVQLVQTAEDGTETITEGEAGVLDITIDVGMLENGIYTFHALAVDEFGNVQTDESSQIMVDVKNFRLSDIEELTVIAVDGTDVSDPPAEPIPLRASVTVSFVVANGSLNAEELSGAVDGSEVPSENAEDPENTFSLMVEVAALVDGVYTPNGVVTKRNGSIAFPLAAVNVDNTGPMVTIESPMEDEAVDNLPTIRATYHDGEGAGVDGATASVALARIQPPDEVEVGVDQAMLQKDNTTLVYTRTEQLPGGAYRVTVQVTDSLGNVGEASGEFAVNGTLPTVAIHSPASGQTFEHGQPLISGEFSGAGTVEVTTFTVNDVVAEPEVEGNGFSYTSEEALADGNHTVVVAVTDGDGNAAQTSVTFTVKMPRDTSPPVISATAPSGLIKGDSWVTLSASVTDDQSSVVSVRFGIDDKPYRSIPLAQIAEGRVEVADSFTPGTHTIKLVAASEGGTTQVSWTFTLVVDNTAPTISSITPSGTIRGGLPVISASANDESGVDKITIVVFDSDGEKVEGDTEDDGEDDVEGITRLDFNPEAPLGEGIYTIQVRATDTIGNSATAKGVFTIDFDTAAPIITMASPQNEARLTNRRPQILIAYADAESGVDVDSIRFVLDDQLINLAPNQKSASQVMYIPPVDLAFGQHTVKLEVSDMAHKEGNVSEKTNGALEANMAVHEFTFFVESEEGPVLASRPINAPNPFKENTRISFTLTRQSTVSIVIYDSTLRPVRVLVDNEVWDAGEYTGKAAIGWDGKTTSGSEDLARGIYFCQIVVADGFEPEYAILKLALTR